MQNLGRIVVLKGDREGEELEQEDCLGEQRKKRKII
jgi:hypothetical protein